MKQNILKKLIISLMILIVTFFSFNFIYNGNFDIDIFELGKKVSFNTNSLSDYATDINLKDDGTYYSKTNDSWFNIDLNYDAKTIIFDIDSVSDICNAQIFYFNNEEALSEEHSIKVTLDNGTYYVQIPTGEYNQFRLDLTDQKGVSIKINSVVFSQSRCLPGSFWISFIIFLACVVILYKLYKHYENLCSKIGEYKYFKYVLAIVIIISCVIVYGSLINSGHQYVYYDIGGGDEPEAYIPLLSSLIQKIQTHSITDWTWNNGLGTSMSGFWGYMANPFTFLVIIVGVFFGISSINTTVLIAQLLNILVVGQLCYKYLSYFGGKARSKAIASYIAAFSGYMILYAQHYVHAEFAIYIFVTLIFVEDVLKHDKFCKSHIFLAIDCAFMFVCTVYLAYMIAIFTGIYTIFRLVQNYNKSQIKLALIKLGQIFGAAIIGFLISMPFVLVVVNELLFNSDRVSSGNDGIFSSILSLLTIPYHKEAFVTIFYRFLSSNLQGAGNDFWGQTDSYANDYYAAPELFYSVFIFVFIAIYYLTLKDRCRDKKQFIVKILAGLFVTFIVFNRLGSAIFNAFVAPFGRYTYLLLPLFAILTVTAIDELEKRTKNVKVSCIFVCTLSIIALIVEFYYAWKNNKPEYILLLAIVDIILLFILLLISSIKLKEYRKITIGLFSILVFINITLESYITVNNRIFCSFSKDVTDQDDYDTQDALTYINNTDNSMYRVEKNYYDIIPFNDSYFQNYRGVSTYNSTLNANVKEFYKLYCNPAINYYSANSFWYSYMNVTNDIIQDSILGVKYIISDSTTYDESQFEKVYSNDSVSVYRNKAIESFGIFYKNAISKSEVLDLGYTDRVSVLSEAIVLEDEDSGNSLNVVDFSYIKNKLDEQEVSYSMNSADSSEIELSLSGDTSKVSYLEFLSNLKYDSNIMIYFDTGEGYEELTPYYYRGNEEQNQEARIAVPSGTKKIKMESSTEDFKVENIRIVTTDEPYVPNEAKIDINMTSDSHLNGTISNNENGYLLLPIPYEKGWTISVDGEETNILQADSGFMAIYLENGKHNIDIQYHFPGKNCGIIFSAFGIGIIFLECVYLHTRRKLIE